MKTKYAKLVVKDSAGNIVQLLPETKVDESLNANSNLPISNAAVAGAFASLGGKDVGIKSYEPTAVNTAEMDNEALIFWNEGSTSGTGAAGPVLLAGNQTIEGQKKFLGGLYGGAYTLGSSEWDFDLTKATCFTKTVADEGTFSFSNVPEATACCITVILHNGGNYAIHWPASVKWTENETPTLTQNGTDVLTFITCTGGNIWYGTTTCIGVTA